MVGPRRSCRLPLLAALAALTSLPLVFQRGARPAYAVGATHTGRYGPARLGSSSVRAAASTGTMRKVADIIAASLDVDRAKVTREARFAELGADSLDMVESLMALEEGFDLELPEKETLALQHVGDVMDLVQSKL
mmetsp:Transcript_119850/g.310980  ORF Transcript_119850/g.310980 Transcript_119850/m.310980 type:complete len:135 (+) Transcript_119850:82-486(+)|eukprot:CAMPEP_0115307224 /NCGR_PEP_ID=MMETSP0270-20121206/73020_1 /TAXON_ID=71861 /ORGANISM="Scrippsiella trochoidea, Strain CCMP3099" /LENGTH=134 /DNA_ID=CAMNT_0002725639 /DNA_START=40 /DNA_END=444 /DNA_ORIENTATION=+